MLSAIRPALRFIVAFFVLQSFAAESAFAWGERGHDLIARVAVRLVGKRTDSAFGAALQEKEHMMGHLANVPDILWRSLGKETDDLNSPTHYINFEFINPTTTFANLPTSPEQMIATMKALCAKPPGGYVCPTDQPAQVLLTEGGTAPFRIRQLFNLMKASFAKARAAPTDASGAKERNAAIDDAWLYGGIMAHFVGDLGNPLHTTSDYNGYERGQGGLHAYYESEAVNALGLDFDNDVYRAAETMKPLERLVHVVPKGEQTSFRQDPLQVSYALVLDSFEHVNEVYALDKKYAVTKAGRNDNGLKIKAERKRVAQTAAIFRPLTTQRLAIAADALATLWILAYEQGGKPDMSHYASWAYSTSPTFIAPDYALIPGLK